VPYVIIKLYLDIVYFLFAVLRIFRVLYVRDNLRLTGT